MAILVTCQCSNTYNLKDEFAGKLVQCPQCGATNRVGQTTFTPQRQADPAFDRDLFLLRQKHLSISHKYTVSDEHGSDVLYVERPAHFLRTVAAILGGLVAAFVAVGVLGVIAALTGSKEVEEAFRALAPLVGVATFWIVGMALSKKRHVSFYRGEDKSEKLLEILQDKKVQLLRATFTLRGADGRTLATLRKNQLTNLIRKRWECRGARGELICVVKEDSIILSLLRRVLGPLYGLLRTNFVIRRSDDGMVLGEFMRKLTILDRYVLDLSPDRRRMLDRRIGVAIGVMLDTAERR